MFYRATGLTRFGAMHIIASASTREEVHGSIEGPGR